MVIDVPPRPVSNQAATALCIEAHDLVLAKCVRGEPRDWEFADEAIAASLVGVEQLLNRVDDLPVEGQRREGLRRMLEVRA